MWLPFVGLLPTGRGSHPSATGHNTDLGPCRKEFLCGPFRLASSSQRTSFACAAHCTLTPLQSIPDRLRIGRAGCPLSAIRRHSPAPARHELLYAHGYEICSFVQRVHCIALHLPRGEVWDCDMPGARYLASSPSRAETDTSYRAPMWTPMKTTFMHNCCSLSSAL